MKQYPDDNAYQQAYSDLYDYVKRLYAEHFGIRAWYDLADSLQNQPGVEVVKEAIRQLKEAEPK